MTTEELLLTLNRQMGELTTSIRGLEARVDSLTNDVSELKDRMTKEESSTSLGRNVVVFVSNIITALVAWWAGNQHG